MHRGRAEATLVTKREQHPELRGRPTWAQILRVAAREGVRVVRQPLPGHWGNLVGYCGRWTVIVGTHAPRARWGYIVLHELAHLWMHHDPSAERHELVFTMADELIGRDDREDDADLLAAMILSPEVWNGR